MFSFADPWLLLAAPAPLLTLLWRPKEMEGHGALHVPAAVFDRLTEAARQAPAAVAARRAAPVLLWLLLVVALAGPRQIAPVQGLPASGRDIVIALDLSGSMEREDFSLDGQVVARLDAVKKVASGFVRGRAGDRIGLVIFAQHAFVAAPLTHDVSAVAAMIEAATIGVAGRSTAVSDGLGLALRRLEKSDATSRTVILLSDGINNSGSVRPIDAARLAAELGVKVHTIALGPRDRGDGGDIRDVVDADTLRAVADLAGGGFFRVRTTEDLTAVTAEIDRTEGSPSATPATDIHRPLWIWPGAAAFLLAIGLVPAFRWRP